MVVPAQVKNTLSRTFRASVEDVHSTNAYSEQYDLAMERITNQPTYTADLARATLAWMTFACRPLTPIELRTAWAIALSEDKTELDPDYLPDMDLLMSICAGLVTVDKEANIVRPAHYTTQDYLKRTHDMWFPDGRKQNALACISYLSLKDFRKLNSLYSQCMPEEHDDKLLTYPLLDYAARYWGAHVRPVEDEILKEVTVVIEDFHVLQYITSVVHSYDDSDVGIHWLTWPTLTPMKAIACEGLIRTLERYLLVSLAKVWPEPELEGYGRQLKLPSPLSIAAERGHVHIVKALLAQPSHYGLWVGRREALWSAAERGDGTIVKVILDSWANGDHGESLTGGDVVECRHSALVKAATYVSLEATQSLLAHGADTESLNNAIDNAVAGGHENFVPLLLYHGGVISYTVGDAVESGREDAVRLLLKLGQNAEASSIEYPYEIPLWIASSHCNRGIVELLLCHGVDIDVLRNFDKTTAPVVAVEQGDDNNGIVRLLLDHGAGFDVHWGGDAGNALQVAARHDYPDICVTLLGHSADVNLSSGDPEQSPVETAFKEGSADTLALLLHHGAEAPVNGVSLSGDFVQDWFHYKSAQKVVRVLSLLNEHGVEMDLDGDGTSLPAIHEAARYGNLPVLEELLRLGADPRIWAGQHGNILHTAVSTECYDLDCHEHAVCVATLLHYGLDVNSAGDIYEDALTAAIMAKADLPDTHPTISLIESGVKIPSNGPELLERSVVECILEVVEHLIKSGVPITTSISYPNILAAAVLSEDPMKMLPLLVSLGADPKVMGTHALDATMNVMGTQALEWLLEQGVYPNAPCDQHSNPLIFAVSVAAEDRSYSYYASDRIVLLIKYGAVVHTYGPAALELRLLKGGTDLRERH